VPEVTRGGTRLYFSRSGEGATVLFHTGGAGNGRMWELAGYTDVIGGDHLLFDHRRRGRSGRPTRVEDHRMGEYVDDVTAVLDAVGVQRAVIVGYSFGACVAYAAAAAHPDRFSAVVGIGGLSSPDAVPTTDSRVVDFLRARGTRAVIEEIASTEDEACPTWLMDNLSTTDSEMFALQIEGCRDAATEWASFPLISAPTLIVCGQREDDGELDLAASTLANVTTVVLPGYGHLQAFWHGEVTAPLIRDFLVSHGVLW
jgi:pimeloyl-ACP methyl ester carboxylesterase